MDDRREGDHLRVALDSCHVSMWLDILLPKELVFVVAAAPAFGQILHGVILTIRGV